MRGGARGNPAKRALQFSKGQRNLAIRALGEAEERTLGYYCIPPYRRQQLRYDLVTRQDIEWEPLPDEALARIQKLQYVRPRQNSAYDFYRIQLNDPGILNVAKRENLQPDFYPFLLYILTHEMVHLVRLTSILPEAGDCHPPMEEEEGRVQKVAYRILSGTTDKRMHPILRKFCTTGHVGGYRLEVPQHSESC